MGEFFSPAKKKGMKIYSESKSKPNEIKIIKREVTVVRSFGLNGEIIPVVIKIQKTRKLASKRKPVITFPEKSEARGKSIKAWTLFMFSVGFREWRKNRPAGA